MNRDPALARLRAGAEVFDLVVVGGGASGLGAAVDAAARGHRVALIERDDFAKGTSSRATKLVHGGVRYLRQGDISLVMSALHERGRMRRNAPHLVHDLEFVIPGYAWWEAPYYALGMTIYDRLAGKWSFGRSRKLSRAQTIELLPTLEPHGLAGGVLYHDGQFDDARLATSLARTAVDHGAMLVNYCACTGLRKESGRVAGVLARDLETGAEFEIRAKAVINATGVFVDEVRRFDEPEGAPLVAVSQGVHVVLPRHFLPGETALMIPKTADGRVLFAIPWHDRVVVGTTDTPGLPAAIEPRALPEEVAFIMEHARKYLSRDPLESDVLSVFAGQRPLVNRSGAGSTAALSRDHTIVVSPSRLITLTGGKWTTYRKMAEDVIDQAEKVAGLAPRPCVTADLPIHGASETGRVFEPSSNAQHAKGQGTDLPYLSIYGSDAPAIAALANSEPALDVPLVAGLPMRQAEVVWHARHEMARTVEDVLARRTRALLLDARGSIAAAPAVAHLLARELGRDESWIAAQTAAYTALARGYLLRAPARAELVAPPGLPAHS
ncbi:MAG: glycerol-3-phosphate dehydrogenase/oxidase [Opitutaceae bacterium]|nr:glycerol-3-phosphate dehydrogenase/oxidase [Opitutaceae bacterium]